MSRSLASIFLLILFLLIGGNNYGQSSEYDSTQYSNTTYSRPHSGFTTTPFTIPKGSLVYHNAYLFVNAFEYGVTDRLTVTAGLYPGIFSIKYNFVNTPDYAFSFTSLNIAWMSNGDPYVVPILYLHGAFIEGRDNFFTLGGGVYIIEGTPRSIFTIGYHRRLTDKLGLMLDLWLPHLDDDIDIIGGFLPMPMIGFRFYTESGAAFDIGFPQIGMRIPLVKTVSKNSRPRRRF